MCHNSISFLRGCLSSLARSMILRGYYVDKPTKIDALKADIVRFIIHDIQPELLARKNTQPRCPYFWNNFLMLMPCFDLVNKNRFRIKNYILVYVFFRILSFITLKKQERRSNEICIKVVSDCMLVSDCMRRVGFFFEQFNHIRQLYLPFRFSVRLGLLCFISIWHQSKQNVKRSMLYLSWYCYVSIRSKALLVIFLLYIVVFNICIISM